MHLQFLMFAALILSSVSLVHAQSFTITFPSDEFPLTQSELRSVELSEILSGGPPRDGIPSIDSPDFIAADQAVSWLHGQEPVIVFAHDDDVRAYPIQILMYHEIVNDTVAGLPVAVTFCPLCNASIVFKRQLGTADEKRVLDFGTTGRLRKSDLIMYDRQTESWWQQFSGRGIIGEYTDTTLEQLPSQIVSFDTFTTTFPDGRVLSRDTGFNRPYGNNPYRGYDAIDNNPFLFDGDIDPRLPAMERVLSIVVDETTHLVPLTALGEQGVVNLIVEDQPLALFAMTSASSALDQSSIAHSRAIPAAAAFNPVLGEQTLSFSLRDGGLFDDQTGSQWNAFGTAIKGKLIDSQLKQLDSGVHFAFAWLAFNPDAEIVTLE